MKHCLNKRDHHETSFDEQEDLPQKLQTRNQGQFQELTHSADARRRKALRNYLNDLRLYYQAMGIK